MDFNELFQQKKWKLGLDAMPIARAVVIDVESANELNTIRVRASEFSRESKTKKVSVYLDYEKKQAIVTISKK